MKLHPSVPLALVLAAGMAGSVLAQTAAPSNTAAPASPQTAVPNSESSWNAEHPQSSYALPQANSGQPQANSAQPQPNSAQQAGNGQMQPTGQMPPQISGDQQVSQAQAQLQASGLYNGPQDGVMDPDTRAAIAKFQAQHGLRRTETLDQPTMAALMSNQTTQSGSGMAATSPAAPSATANPAPSSVPNSAGGTMNR
jgi:hypothetical protein